MRLTPEQEAGYALDYGVARAGLKPPVQAEYDRLLAERLDRATRMRGQAPLRQQADQFARRPARASFQASPLPPKWLRNWPAWLLAAGLAGVVLAVIVGGFGGPGTDALDVAAGALLLIGLAAVCVAVPAALFRWYRTRRAGARSSQPVRTPFAPCYGCGYPLSVHSSDGLKCPEAGVCYRCGQPFTVHVGYELTCPSSAAPPCYRCGQPFATHVRDQRMCPAPSAMTHA